MTLKGDGNKEYTIKAGYLKGVFWSYGPDEIGKIKTDSNGYGYGEFSTFPESWKNKVISEPDKNALNAVKIEGLLTYNNVFNSANVTFYANNPESNGVWSNDLRYARCNFNTNIEPHLKDRPWWTGNSDNLNSSWFLANGNPNSSIRVFYDSSMPGGAPAYTYTPVNILELQAKHNGCWDVARMMTSDCFAAIHRYCEQEKGYGAGISQEVSDPNVNVHCFNPGWSGDVNIGELTLKHSGCDSVSKAMTSDCFAAIHRYCEQEKGYAAGVPQEVGSSSIGVHCFNVGWSGDVNIAALTAKGRPCSTSNIMKSDCLADIHRYCEQEKGYGAGISQEVSDPNVNVHCFNAGWDGSSVDQSSNIRGNVKINIGNFDPNFMRDCKFDVYVCSQYSFAENSEDSILKITDSIANFNPASISTIKDYGDFQIIKFNTIRFVLDKDYTIQEIKNAIKTGFRLWEQNGFIYSNFFTNLDWLAAKNNEGLDSSAWAESNDGAIYSGDCWDSVTDERAVDMDSRKLIGQCTGDICKENLKVRIAFKYKKPSADPLSSRFPKSPLIPMITFCSEVPVGGTCTGTRECNNPGNPDPVCEAKYGTGSSCLSNCQCQVLPPQTFPKDQDSFTESSTWFVNGATQRGISCWENPSPYSNCYDDFSFFPCGLTSTTLDGKSPAKGQKSLGIQIATINNLRLDITCANGGNGVKISDYPFLNFKVHGITDDYKLNLWAELDRTGTPTQPSGFYDRECPTTAYDFGTGGDWQTYRVDLTKCTKWNGASDGDIFKYLIIGWDHSNTATVYIDNLYFSKT